MILIMECVDGAKGITGSSGFFNRVNVREAGIVTTGSSGFFNRINVWELERAICSPCCKVNGGCNKDNGGGTEFNVGCTKVKGGRSWLKGICPVWAVVI